MIFYILVTYYIEENSDFYHVVQAGSVTIKK